MTSFLAGDVAHVHNAADEGEMGNDVCDFEGHRRRRPCYAGTLYVQGCGIVVVAIMGWHRLRSAASVRKETGDGR